MGKKNLEQLFKESFQDFQEVPDKKVWNSIEASLDKKKQKKRVIPIWWSLGGVAAALAILLLAINPFAEEPKEEQIITDLENIAVPDETGNSEEKRSKGFNSPVTTSEKQGDGLANTSDSEDLEEGNHQTTDNGLHKNKVSAIAENVASTNSKTNDPAGKTQAKNNGLIESEALSSEKDGAEKNSAIAMNGDEGQRRTTQTDGDNTQVAQHTEEKAEAEKKSIYDAIEEQKEIEEAVAENKTGKWSVGPSLAPVYFDAIGDGSPVGADFSSNSKSGKFNLSYGLTVAYEVGKKLKIRSGVHRVNYGYNTNDVVFSSTLRAASANRIANIDYNPNSESIIVQSRESAKNAPAINSKEVLFNEAPSLDGKMVQQLGYIEVPLEVNYAVLDKKLGVDLIGGVSSLFLVDNSVLLESNELVTEMGEANNINALNFSANVGMGLNYKFTPKVRFNIEPVLKYQLNTFSNVSGNFKPYSIGIYSGISFKF
ncbi:hypothetical protein [Flagellimonas halotolerans]|uniref:Outer membrane protein beta-barrel domain-containing protein n=1 Tax=Flagellimonas halotolerans TaxID=3112164 RepID=A0ABU6ILD1_9FLAO|nr:MULTISPECIES: hypothetical protein [unclassified Allomuricauda]MEC3964040.1 hypothetical protein [Muricauda sp. SYSU M86414]MEC4263910.1 hypothetical protein [Muricauda sp. SYSU M84420]